MPAKNFKDTSANIDRFFSHQPVVNKTEETQETFKTHKTHETQNIKKNPGRPKLIGESFRVHLRLPIEQKRFIEDEAWRNRLSVTKYFISLVKAEMDKRA